MSSPQAMVGRQACLQAKQTKMGRCEKLVIHDVPTFVLILYVAVNL
jgi:hypothetical protein